MSENLNFPAQVDVSFALVEMDRFQDCSLDSGCEARHGADRFYVVATLNSVQFGFRQVSHARAALGGKKSNISF
ncbi:MAG: hypothetical protein CMM01_24320 [Rhodopirellula sp.]|nr:hypothetical protein [Rhodopirellula sp.]